MASRRPRLMGEESSGGDVASENRRELREGGRGMVSGQPPDPRGSGRGGGGSPSPPYLSILSHLSDGFFTTAGMVGTGATFVPSVEQGSPRGQHSPSPNSGQGTSSVSRIPLNLATTSAPPSLPPQPGGPLGRYRSSGPPGRAGWGR